MDGSHEYNNGILKINLRVFSEIFFVQITGVYKYKSSAEENNLQVFCRRGVHKGLKVAERGIFSSHILVLSQRNWYKPPKLFIKYRKPADIRTRCLTNISLQRHNYSSFVNTSFSISRVTECTWLQHFSSSYCIVLCWQILVSLEAIPPSWRDWSVHADISWYPPTRLHNTVTWKVWISTPFWNGYWALDHLYTRIWTISNYSATDNFPTIHKLLQHPLSLLQPIVFSPAVPW
jgi:hypothetical protein